MEPTTVAEGISEEAAIVRLLAERDEPCPKCGYNLRGIGSSKCPECGEAVTFRVVRDDLIVGRVFVYIAALLLVGHSVFGAYALVTIGTAEVMQGLDNFYIVLTFVSWALQVVLSCIGGAISVMARSRSKTLASRRLMQWVLVVMSVNLMSLLIWMLG